MIYWPGTRIPKSNGNVFDWKGSVSVMSDNKSVMSQKNATTKKALKNRANLVLKKEKR